MNIKFLFNHLKNLNDACNDADPEEFSYEFLDGYKRALFDIESYLKESIKVTKEHNDRLAKRQR